MAVKFNSSGGGSVTLDAPSTASNLTVTLPSASGTLVSTGSPFSGGTANGVVYLNGSSVPTTGSALTFDGTNLGLGSSTINTYYDRTQQIYGTASSSLKLTNATAGTANTDGFDVALNGTTALLYNRENGDMAFGVNNVEGMRLTSTGLGIGTSSPNPQSGVFTPYLTVKGASYDGVMQVLGSRGDGANTGVGQFNFLQDGNTTYKTVAQVTSETEGTTANNRGGRLMFFTKADGATSTTERMRIDSSGNVGIGTSSPAQSWTGGAAKVVQIQNASSGITVLRVNDSAGTSGDLQLVSSTGADTAIYNFANGAMRFGTNSTERMRIDSSGNLLVGTTVASPNGSADIMRVAGGVTASLAYCKERAAGVQVNNGATVVTTNAVDDQRIVEVVVASLAGANTTAAPGMYLISRAGTGTAITTVAAAAGVAVSLNGSYQVVMTNNSGQTRYITYTFTVKGGYY